jgi:hypothetical protein
MTTELREAIARLRQRVRLGSPYLEVTLTDITLVCDALEVHLKPAPKFDKVAYQREYMRKRREALRTSNSPRG